MRIIVDRLPGRLRELADADNTAIIQDLFSWVREREHKALCMDSNLLPVRRLFEQQWEHNLAGQASRLEHLSSQMTEVNARLILPSDFLFKVDTASMKESLEIRVPFLDEDLFAFGLTLPHNLKVKARTCKRVLRTIAERKLPLEVARKPKRGFAIPVDSWVDRDFKSRLRDTLLGPSSNLAEYFCPNIYRNIIEAFCADRPFPGLSRQGLYQRAIMLLSVQVISDQKRASTKSSDAA
jgi:asparagine synthase (glutamine-hydrolysing)